MEAMSEKILLEFFPELIFELPEAPGGSCCLKPILTQSKNSKKMYLFAQHLRWKFKDNVELVIPSKTKSRILLVKKYIQFKADWRKKRIGVQRLPALALAGKLLCQGALPNEETIERTAEEVLNAVVS
jgi:hypothetical protein